MMASKSIVPRSDNCVRSGTMVDPYSLVHGMSGKLHSNSGIDPLVSRRHCDTADGAWIKYSPLYGVILCGCILNWNVSSIA